MPVIGFSYKTGYHVPGGLGVEDRWWRFRAGAGEKGDGEREGWW